MKNIKILLCIVILFSSMSLSNLHASEKRSSLDYVEKLDDKYIEIKNKDVVEDAAFFPNYDEDDINNTFINNVYITELDNGGYALYSVDGHRLTSISISSIEIVKSYKCYNSDDRVNEKYLDKQYNNRFIKLYTDDDRLRLFDTEEERILPNEYTYMEDFINGIAKVKVGELEGAINKEGVLICEVGNHYVTVWGKTQKSDEGYVDVYENENLTKCINYNGDVTFQYDSELEYNSVYLDYPFVRDYIILDNDSNMQVYDLNGNLMFTFDTSGSNDIMQLTFFNKGFQLIENEKSDVYLVNKNGNKKLIDAQEGRFVDFELIVDSSEFLFKMDIRWVDEEKQDYSILIREDGSFEQLPPDTTPIVRDLYFADRYISYCNDVYDSNMNLIYPNSDIIRGVNPDDTSSSKYLILTDNANSSKRLINVETNTVSEPYDEIYCDSTEYILVKKNEKYGFINSLGKEIISPKYDYDVYSGGNYYGEIDIDLEMTEYDRAIIKLDNGNLGIMDSNGKIYSPEFKIIYPFRDKLTLAKTLNDEYVYIDLDGNIVLDKEKCPFFNEVDSYASVSPFINFSEGIACVFTEDDNLIYFDDNGKIIARFNEVSKIIPFEDEKCNYQFNQGKAIVPVYESLVSVDYGLIFVINKNYNNDNEDTEPSDKTYTEREIFETYPESLDNETDDIVDDALNIANYYTDTANKNVDFLTLLKQSASNIDDSIELILKSLFTGNTDFKNQEYVDEVVRQILYDALNNQDLLVECAQNLSSKYKDKYKNVKDAINLSVKENIDYEITAEVLAKNFNGNIKEIEKAVKKTYKGWDSKLSEIFKGLDVGITYADALLMAIQTQQMQEEMISLLRSKLPDSTIKRGLIRLQKDIKEGFWKNIIDEFSKEKITDMFVGGFKDLILNVGLDYMIKTPASLARFLGEFIVENFAKNFIPRDSVDAVVKNSVYMGTVCSIYSTILKERTKFVTAFTIGEPLENIEKEINNYHMLYDVFMSSVVGYLENSKDLANKADKEKIDKLIDEMKWLDYDNYLHYCVKKIKKNAFYFSWRETENGVSITGINESQKARMETLSDGYDGNKMGSFLVIPDEINGEPVVSIDSNAITGDFDGIILGKNIKKLDENAIVSDKSLSMIDINSYLTEFSEKSLPDADVYKSASKVFNEKYADSKNILKYDDYVDSIEIATSPDNMDYTPSKGYDSKGLSIKVNKDNDSKIIKGGWLEYVTVENSKPVLNIVYADKKVKTEIDLVKERMNYNIHYVDTNFEQIKETDVVTTNGLAYIEETAPNIKGYSLVDQINGFYLNDSQKDVYFIYRQNIAFQHGNYLVNFKDKVKVNIVGMDNNKCAFTVEDKSIAEISKDGTIIPKKGGITTIKVSDEKGNYDSALLLVDDFIIKINFKNEEYNISVGDSLKLEVLYAPEISKHSKNLTFMSDNPKVVAVNEEGVVTGLAKGNTKITVKTDNGLETTCIVNVSENKKDNTEEISNVDKTNNSQNELNDKDSPDTGSQSSIILFGALTLVSILAAIILKRKSNQKAVKK